MKKLAITLLIPFMFACTNKKELGSPPTCDNPTVQSNIKNLLEGLNREKYPNSTMNIKFLEVQTIETSSEPDVIKCTSKASVEDKYNLITLDIKWDMIGDTVKDTSYDVYQYRSTKIVYKLSETVYNEVIEGMDFEEVTKRFGPPDEILNPSIFSPMMDPSTRIAIWAKEKTTIQVLFVDNKVSTKTRTGL